MSPVENATWSAKIGNRMVNCFNLHYSTPFQTWPTFPQEQHKRDSVHYAAKSTPHLYLYASLL